MTADTDARQTGTSPGAPYAIRETCRRSIQPVPLATARLEVAAIAAVTGLRLALAAYVAAYVQTLRSPSPREAATLAEGAGAYPSGMQRGNRA